MFGAEERTGMTNLVANAVVQNVLFQVCSLSVLGIGTAAQNAQVEVQEQPSQGVRILKQLVQDPLLCAIVAAVRSSASKPFQVPFKCLSNAFGSSLLGLGALLLAYQPAFAPPERAAKAAVDREPVGGLLHQAL